MVWDLVILVAGISLSQSQSQSQSLGDIICDAEEDGLTCSVITPVSLSVTVCVRDYLISDCEYGRETASVMRTATLQTPSHAMLTRVSF